jgi:hypothetical protein
MKNILLISVALLPMATAWALSPREQEIAQISEQIGQWQEHKVLIDQQLDQQKSVADQQADKNIQALFARLKKLDDATTRTTKTATLARIKKSANPKLTQGRH